MDAKAYETVKDLKPSNFLLRSNISSYKCHIIIAEIVLRWVSFVENEAPNTFGIVQLDDNV